MNAESTGWQSVLSAHESSRVALSDGKGLQISYLRLQQEIESLKLKLLKHSVTCCAMFLDNSPAWVVVDLALQEAGLIGVSVAGFFSNQQCRHVVEHTGCSWLITDNLQTADVFSVSPESVLVSQVCGYDIYLVELPENSPQQLMPDHTVKVSFTSGSTGTPKGLCYSEANLLNAASAVADSIQLADTSLTSGIHLSVMPLALLLENVAGVYASLLAGAQCVVPSLQDTGIIGASGVDVVKLADCLYSSAASSCILVPEIVNGLLALPPAMRALPNLRFIAVGGAPIQESVLKRCRESGLPVFQGYGLSEACSVVSLNLPHKNRPDSVGTPVSHQQIFITEEGEIALCEPGFIGYVGSKEAAPRPFPTGDIGFLDDDNYLYFKCRKNTMITTPMGRNIAPEWIESLVCGEACIQHAFVYLDKSCKLSVLVSSPEPEENLADIIQRINTLLPDYARLHHWRRVEQFAGNSLLTDTGKLKRTAIAQHYQI